MAYLGRSQQPPTLDPDGRGLAAMGRFIPVDSHDRMIISYPGPPSRARDPENQTVKIITFSDVLEGKFDPADFRDKMVFLGLLDAAGFADDYQVPTSGKVGKMKGVEIHAHTFATLVSARFFTDQQFPVTAAFIILLCLLGGLAAARLSIIPAFIVTLLGGGAYFFGALEYSELYYDQLGVAIPNLLYPPVALVVSFVCVTVYRVVFEQAETRATRGAMGKYLSPGVLTEVLKDPDALKLGGEKRVMTALFTDIRGFTSVSEKLDPQELVALLNEYLTEMTDVVHKWEGVLDKYMGDAIMAWWGAPGEQPDHSYRACRTAIEMRQELAKLRVGWEARGVPQLEMGVGVNTGPMVYGNTGSRDRFDFTVLGDAVNLASRLEGVNKEYGSNVIISESTLEQLRLVGSRSGTAGAPVVAAAMGGDVANGHDTGGGVALATRPAEMGGGSNEGHDFMVRPLDLIAVKGKTEPVQIYELIGLKGEVADYVPELVQAWDLALGLYRERRFNDAAGAFDEIIERFPHEKPTPERPITPSGVYAERCREMAETPPPADWDGVYVMTHK
jgi:adenylate cyclase